MHPIEFISNAGSSTAFDRDAVCCIVQLPVDFTHPDQARPMGTGFYFCSTRLVITAKHIFVDGDEDYGPYFVLNLARNGNSGLTGYLATIEHIQPFGPTDIAAIVIGQDQSPSMVPFLPASHNHLKEQGFLTVGYSPRTSAMLPSRWECGISVNHCSLIAIEERERIRQPSEFSITLDAPFSERGHSGGPLLNVDGRVVGVLSEVFAKVESTGDNTRLPNGRATSVKPLIDFIKGLPEFSEFPPDVKDWLVGDTAGR